MRASGETQNLPWLPKTTELAQRKESGEATVRKSCQQIHSTESQDMAATIQQRHFVLLDDLTPELLRKIVDLCADDTCVGQATLLGLSVMNKYLRSVTAARLFERICFRDGPASPGDEIIHSIRSFKTAPELWTHARTASLYLNRLDCLKEDPTAPPEPYHYFILPEFVQALLKMPKVTELYIHADHELGRNCLRGLKAAVHWCLPGSDLNIRSLTVKPDSLEYFGCQYEEQPYDIEVIREVPQLKAFCVEVLQMSTLLPTLMAFRSPDPPIGLNLTQLRVYKTCSDPRSGFSQRSWLYLEFQEMKLENITPQLECLSFLGELDDFPVSLILTQLHKLPKLKYLDITDEQIMDDYFARMQFIKATQPRQGSDRLNYIKYLARNHTLNEDRSKISGKTFSQNAQLRRICFVRSCVGEVYLRGYPDVVADSTGFVSSEVNGDDLSDIPQRWHHGVPQTGLIPFPGFTPWEGIEEVE